MLSALLESPRNTRIVLCTTAAVLVTGYVFVKWLKLKRHFKSLNIPSGPTPLPIAGNIFDLMKNGFAYFDLNMMKKYGKKKRVVGYFVGSSPVILCTDPEMIKHVLIKDFSYFVNRRVFDIALVEPFDKVLTVLKDDEWKSVRSIVTTTFTSGKLKGMFKMMCECAEVALKHIETISSNDEYFEPKNFFGSFTIDVISSCCFGVQTDALNEPNSEFIKHIKKVFSSDIRLRLLLLFILPKFAKFASDKGWIDFFPTDSLKYLGRVVDDIIEQRKSKTSFRNDFIQIMVDHENEGNIVTEDDTLKEEENAENITKPSNEWKQLRKTLTSKEILSQAIVFLTAGYETTATTLQFVAYNLAMYPECQNKLCAEIDKAFAKHGSLNFDMLNDIPYLDMVISETLRMYPPAMRLDRVAGFDYTYNDMKLPKSSVWVVPIYALHHDPEFYPDPETFLPERFSPELKKQRENSGTYLPFGLGPRNCIGLRFATIEMKIILAEILSKYEFSICDKTPINIKLVSSGLLKPKEPIILKLKTRLVQ